MAIEKVRVIRLAHVTYQHPDLEKALSFLLDFGFVEQYRSANRVYLRGYGQQPFIYVAEQSPDSKRHFVGGAWVVDRLQDLETAASKPGASSIQDSDAPGGGKIVTLTDPNGFKLEFVHGQELREGNGSELHLEQKPAQLPSNTVVQKPRKGTFRRFKQGASPVHKLGHYGFVVPGSKYESTLSWYLDLINLKPSDAVFNPQTGKDETVFNHIDLGQEYTDHHSLFFAVGPEEAPVHVHHSSYEVNDFDTQTLGHDFLRFKGWTNCWGIGRHVLGSQIFDYWFDGSGNIVEHYSDGDLVNEDTPFTREAAAADTLHIWGPNIPLGFLTGRIEDAGKEAPQPPDVINAIPAQLPQLTSLRRLGLNGAIKADNVFPRRCFGTSPDRQEGFQVRDTPQGSGRETLVSGTSHSSLLPGPTVLVVDDKTSLKNMLDRMLDLPAKPPSLYIDAEGENLGRKGTLALLQIMVRPQWCTYIVDIHVLKSAAFTTCASDGTTTLKSILESERIPKVIFDARNDSANLFSEYGILLGRVHDLQLMEYFSRPVVPGFTVLGLAKCIEQHLHLSPDMVQKWMLRKESGKKLYHPKFGGSSKVFFHRPLPSNVLAYAAGDVEYLGMLYQKYRRNMPRQRWKWMLEKSHNRVRTVHLPTFALEHDRRWAAPKWTGKWDQDDKAPIKGTPHDIVSPATVFPSTNRIVQD
ncbi:hypothetical protein LTR84_011618 [Exophiala bonariae]|uniref:VOC domain-containing protein n=1 Tax=Exophiala bonariae TaxID=1690606 RepID=A0AAV9NJ10_9EURO|nr:hypothetical protein LTR84_011618 [Exophiala bonariae]